VDDRNLGTLDSVQGCDDLVGQISQDANRLIGCVGIGERNHGIAQETGPRRSGRQNSWIVREQPRHAVPFIENWFVSVRHLVSFAIPVDLATSD
jgi:hypothetical protein